MKNYGKRLFGNLREYMETASIWGAATGYCIGAFVGTATPVHLGFQLGEWISYKNDISGLASYAVELGTAIGTLGIVGGVTLPLGMVIGSATGAIAGAGAGFLLNAAVSGKDVCVTGLEKLLVKNKDQYFD